MIDTNGNLVVVDVREENEYCDAGATPPGHIPGALNYPWTSGVLEDRYDELPNGRPILVVCLSGGRSAQASNFLCTHGFSPAYSMTGGMSEWEWETIGCCSSHEDCDDDLYCNGEEVCVDLNCQPGSPPCEPSYCCDEENYPDYCSDHQGDADCDGVPDDGGGNSCTTGQIVDCDDNCPDHPNGPAYGTCVKLKADVIVSYRVGDPRDFITCTSNADCEETGGTCQMNQGNSSGKSCGDACECYADDNEDGAVSTKDYGILKHEFGRYDCPSTPGSGTGDTDVDGVIDEEDNCPDHPNGDLLGTCVKLKADIFVSYRVGDPEDFITCTSDADCTDTGATCDGGDDPGQGDCNGNGVGDVCECYADDNEDGAVTTKDYGILKHEFGRYDCPSCP